MSSHSPSTDLAFLLTQLAVQSARPFEQAVVQSPWVNVLDCPTLYPDAKDHLTRLVRESSLAGNHARCAVVLAPPGFGKTHLLAWLREQIVQQKDGLFVYVPPMLPTGLPLDNHLVRAAIDSLSQHPAQYREQIAQGIRAVLVRFYDEAIFARGVTLADLGISRTLTGVFWPRVYKIVRLSPAEQDAALQMALGQRRFLQFAFDRFLVDHPAASNGTRIDFETFVAVSLLNCGNDEQRAAAGRWFQSPEDPFAERARYHLNQPCAGQEKTRNCLFTLQALVQRPFCIAFDQFDDPFNAFFAAGRWPELQQCLSYVVNTLSVLPNFVQIFAFEVSVWEGSFRRQAPGFLIDRLTADGGELRLLPLRDGTARDLIRTRLHEFVWSKLPGLHPPEDQPCYPFTDDEIVHLRQESDGELRDFLSRARRLYSEILSPTPCVQSIEPTVGIRDEPTRILIRGAHLPQKVRILFNDRAAVSIDCHTDVGEIRATTPTGLSGLCRVVVLDAVSGEPIQGELAFTFQARPDPPVIPRPLHQHVDRALMKQLRTARHLTQAAVGVAVGKARELISKFENGQWGPDDAVIEKMAELYGVTLQEILLSTS